MGKGLILSHLGAGRYRVRLLLDVERALAETVALTTKIIEIAAAIAAKEGEITAQQATIDSLETALRLLTPGTEAWRKKAEELRKAVNALAAKVQQKDLLTLKKAGYEKRQAYIEANIPADPEIDAWCADLTTDLAGEVGTIEVPGERGQVMIQPGHEGNAAYNAARDGRLQPTVSANPFALIYNLAMLPGWQKWMPGYRIGEITAVDWDADTCDVTLDEAVSTQPAFAATKFDVNYPAALTGVPVSYMT